MAEYNELKVDIMMGLPGSGKTTLCNKINKNSNEYKKTRGFTRPLYLDGKTEKEMDKLLEKTLMSSYFPTERNDVHRIIVDGLFLTNDDVVKMIKMIQQYDKHLKVTVHSFKEDRETCLHNDLGRRTKSSMNTIKYAKVEIPDANFIKEQTGLLSLDVKRYNVYRKPDVDVLLEDNGYSYHIFCSGSWSLGGTYGNCYDDKLFPVSPDTPPNEFKEFDNFLEKICPNISFLQYKKLYNSCVKVETKEEHDYYGGCVTYAYFECDLKRLLSEMEEMGIFNVSKAVEDLETISNENLLEERD
jgi:adenylate kinase family enzyme